MNLEDVIQDGSKFLKLGDGESVKGRFSGDFEKRDSSQYGTKYEITFNLTNGDTKTWSGSSAFYDQCRKAAANVNQGFFDTVFKITRTGQGMDTRYNVNAVVDGQTVTDEQPGEGAYNAQNPFA